MVEKLFYMKLEKIAEELGTQPDIIINNTLLFNIEKTGETIGAIINELIEKME